MSAPNPEDERTDAALFRAALDGVEPLPAPNRADLKPTPRHAYLGQTPAPLPGADILSDSCDSPPPDEYLGNGLSRMNLRKLRRQPVQDKLDLHGLYSDQARALLQTFLLQAQQQGARCVLVIHGKGMNSAGGEPILKLHTRNWLRQLPGVLAYCDAPPGLGGSGAVLVLLKGMKDGTEDS